MVVRVQVPLSVLFYCDMDKGLIVFFSTLFIGGLLYVSLAYYLEYKERKEKSKYK